ncbi:MAG TPA: methyltransferase domain-containing protein [Burkholderiales bacterium]|nr:methyltransferase domain-containing protein [Burkholderiales bacterium]
MPGIDRRTARRRFDRAAPTYSEAARLEAEVATRMLERLDYMKIEPRRILDAGSGPPGRALGKRYPQAQVIALDFSVGMLRAGKRVWFGTNPYRVGADMERLPLAAEAVHFIWCNMALHWLADPLPALREFARVLVPEGLLMFSTLGPDTLKELRAAAGASRVHSFTDMHDLGDMLVAAGFTAPVMDMEMLDIAYRDPAALLADLRASGQTSARADRPRGLSGRRYGEALRAKLGPKATFEVVYGHAWKAGRKHPKVEPAPKTVRVFKRMP